MTKMVLAAMAAIAVLSTSATQAQGQVPARHVRTADLNLASDQGVKALDRRISAAARAVCDSPDNAELSARIARRACIASARLSAQARRDQQVIAARTLASQTRLNR